MERAEIRSKKLSVYAGQPNRRGVPLNIVSRSNVTVGMVAIRTGGAILAAQEPGDDRYIRPGVGNKSCQNL